MSIRFAIKNTAAKAETESDGTILRYSGTGEPFIRVSERASEKIGEDQNENPILQFNTGLNEEKVEFFNWYSDDEKKEVLKQIKNLKPIIAKFYGGEKVLDENNKFFWKDTREVSRLSLSNSDIDVFYDTKTPVHALLYLSLVSGAFIDLVAPTRDWAERHQIPHYLSLETEETFEEEDEITRSDAHAALGELRKDESPEALFILAWCLQYDTNAFGAYTKATPHKDMVNYHIKYIDGKLVTKKKRNMPKTFLEYATKWKGQQTRPTLYTEAYVKAGEYYSFIQQKEKKYTTQEGTVLGNTISEAVTNLMKPKFHDDLENLRDKVEAKWKE